MVTKDELIAFEADIAELFTAKQIPAVTHLCGEAEEELIAIFKDIRPQDWICCSWRSHYHALLKGVPPKELKAAILSGNSVHLSFPNYRMISSAIVGGMLPIATGIAMGIKRSGEDARVHCFIGDMTSELGIAHECMKYSRGFDLPIEFHIEDNGRSAQTDTKKVWGITELTNKPAFSYERKRYLHAGAKDWISF